MIVYENGCVGCEVCRGFCSNKHIEKHICDNCLEDDVQLYEFDGHELCLGCIEEKLDKIN